MTLTAVSSLIVLSLWMKWYGYQMVTGNSQASAKDFVFKAVRAWIIIAFATGLAASMGFSIRAVTTDLSNLISSAMTGSTDASKCTSTASDSGFMGCKIDQNLIRAQAAMAFVNQLDTGGDAVLEDKKSKASLMTAAGIGGPAIVAGAFLLTLKVAMALFISLGPIFIMCLLFKQTTQLFWKWLYYGLSTMFATAMLAVVSDIAMDLVENISGALFVSDLFTNLLGSAALSGNTAGIMQASMQQLGLGLILSTLLISTPPMAAQFFNGVMGQFSTINALDRFASASAVGMPPMGGHAGAGYGTTGVAGARGVNGTPAPSNAPDQGRSGSSAPQSNVANLYTPSSNTSVNQDVIKPSSDIGNASKGFASNELAQADKSVKDQAVKLSLMLVSGALVWTGGAMNEAKAQSADFWRQAEEQQRRQQEQAFQLQQQQLWQQRNDPQYACVGGRDVYGYIGDAACGGGVNTGNTAPPPVIQKPSSYGAVAWDEKRGLYGSASKQASKQAAIDMALQRCNSSNCEIMMEYANQCTAVAYGLEKGGTYFWQFSSGLTQSKAVRVATAKCSKRAKNCKILLSECSLP